MILKGTPGVQLDGSMLVRCQLRLFDVRIIQRKSFGGRGRLQHSSGGTAPCPTPTTLPPSHLTLSSFWQFKYCSWLFTM